MDPKHNSAYNIAEFRKTIYIRFDFFFLTENYKYGYKFELMKQCNKLIALLYRLAVCLVLLKSKFSGGISLSD